MSFGETLDIDINSDSENIITSFIIAVYGQVY